MKMDQDLKQKWIEALLSGKYTQGGGYLRRDGRYCCLGVLAEVCGVNDREWAPTAGTLDDIGKKDLLGPWTGPHGTPYNRERPDAMDTVQKRLAAMNDL